MADNPQIPNAGDIVGPGIDKLVQVRPSAAPFVQSGRYGDVIAGWRGQYELERKRLAEEVAASRLTGSGAALTELARSEFDTERQDLTTAIGEIVLVRKVPHAVAMVSVAIAPPTDQASADTAIAALSAACLAHVGSIYNSSLQTGAHVLVADTFSNFTFTAIGSLAETVLSVNRFKFALAGHLINTGASAPPWHLDPDTSTQLTTPLAVLGYTLSPAPAPHSANDTWAFASPSCQQSIQKLFAAILLALNTHQAIEARAGSIRKGTRIAVVAAPTAVPPVLGANYIVSQDTAILAAVQTATPPITATRTGASSNQATWFPAQTLTLTVDPLFDAAVTFPLAPTLLRAAGGSDGQGDAALRRAAKASWTGRYGPTVNAAIAGALRANGVAHLVLREDVISGTNTGFSGVPQFVAPAGTGQPGFMRLFVADSSWSQSAAWLARIQQYITDNWLGFGERIAMYQIFNQLIRVQLTISLRDARNLADTTQITDNVQKAVKKYFDGRPDWWAWRLTGLRSSVSRADRRILACASAVVSDGASVPLAEPPSQPGIVIAHYALADNPTTILYQVPT